VAIRVRSPNRVWYGFSKPFDRNGIRRKIQNIRELRAKNCISSERGTKRVHRLCDAVTVKRARSGAVVVGRERESDLSRRRNVRELPSPVRFQCLDGLAKNVTGDNACTRGLLKKFLGYRWKKRNFAIVDVIGFERNRG